VETEAKDAYNNYQQDDQGDKLNTAEFAEQEYKDFTQPQVTLAFVGFLLLSVKSYSLGYNCFPTLQSNNGGTQPQQQQR